MFHDLNSSEERIMLCQNKNIPFRSVNKERLDVEIHPAENSPPSWGLQSGAWRKVLVLHVGGMMYRDLPNIICIPVTLEQFLASRFPYFISYFPLPRSLTTLYGIMLGFRSVPPVT